VTLVAGGIVLVPALIYLYTLFQRAQHEPEPAPSAAPAPPSAPREPAGRPGVG
jgi:hypothetical protein